MDLVFDTARAPRDRDWSYDGARDFPGRSHIIFSIEDLPTIVVILLTRIDSERNPMLRVNVREYLPEAPTSHHSIVGGYIEPLRYLCGLDRVDVTGQMILPNQDALKASMRGKRQSAKQIMHELAVRFDRADGAFKSEHSALAISEYKTALFIIHGSHFDEIEEFEVLIGGQFDGIAAGWYVYLLPLSLLTSKH